MGVRNFAWLAASSFFALSFVGAVPHTPISAADAFAQEQKEVGTVTGKVAETMNVAGYTYMLVENQMGEQWVAIPESEVTVGQSVTYVQGMVMNKFYSKTMDRTFDTIIFSAGLAGQVPEKKAVEKSAPAEGASSFEAAVMQENNMDEGPALADNPNGSAGAVAPMVATIKVEKAAGENGYTVEEVFAQGETLAGKTVRVKGQVVKVNMNIMARNWVHLQDGSGNPMQNTHDLVITTKEDVEEGKPVTLEGVVAFEKDFGYGYKYNVLVEDAKIVTP